MHTKDGDIMIIFEILLYALLPFLHDTIYRAQLISCEPNEIILKSEEETFEVELFNMLVEEKGWSQVCGSLKNATEISFEIDKSSAIQSPLPVYLFSDHYLIQEDLIKKGLGYSRIHNPEYKYENKLQEIETDKQVIAQEEPVEKTKKRSYGWIKYCILMIVWVILFYCLFHTRKKKL